MFIIKLILVFSFPVSHSAPASSKRPHIIFFLFDDLGYNEVNWINGNENRYHLPTLDSMAREGVVFASQYYVGTICTPSRAMLMTGRYSTRLGTQSYVIYPETPWAVAKEEEFIPQILSKHAGYTNFGVGKWHLGMMAEWALPTNRGFHRWDGYLGGCKTIWTHVSACCTANSSLHDQDYICSIEDQSPEPKDEQDNRRYDWYRNA